MKRKHKSYSKPKRPFDKVRFEEEAEIKKKFGLKNKKEIWKAEAKINAIRTKAKRLISAGEEEQKKLFDSLKKIGLNVNSIADVLSLEKEDYLGRRLQTIVLRKRIATTPRGARQLIVHKKISVGGRIVNIPSYIVPVKLEDRIELIKRVKKKEISKEAPKLEDEEVKQEEVKNE